MNSVIPEQQVFETPRESVGLLLRFLAGLSKVKCFSDEAIQSNCVDPFQRCVFI